ncbi:MAG: hypothetical protein K940chlam3_00835 [Chlamydiae bacterium]|nr:hypothetical protein [Chlamydiota bacterium]
MKIVSIITAILFPISAYAGNCCLHSLTLESAERIALENNNDIKTLQQLVAKAQQGRLEAVSKWFPEVVLISSGYKTEKIQTFTGTHSAFLSQFNVTQALLSTERYFNLRISSLVVKQLRLLLDAIIIDVMYDIRQAYYRVILDYQDIATAKTNIDLFMDLAEKEQTKYKIGTSILLNVNQSTVRIANATKAYYQAIKELKVDLDYLTQVLGYDPGTLDLELAERTIPIMNIPEIASKVNRIDEVFRDRFQNGFIFKEGYPYTQEKLMRSVFTAQEIACWENTALTFRPTLRSKATDVKIAAEFVGSKWGEFLPEVNLEMNYGGYPTNMLDNPSSNFLNQKFDWAVGYRVNWLLWDSLGRDHRIKQAMHEKCAKQFEYMKGVQMAYADVRRQMFDIEESIANFVTAKSNVKLAEQTLELAQSSLEIGYINVFDYQIIIDSLIQAMNTQNEAQFDLIRGYYGLIHASGADLMYTHKTSRFDF